MKQNINFSLHTMTLSPTEIQPLKGGPGLGDRKATKIVTSWLQMSSQCSLVAAKGKQSIRNYQDQLGTKQKSLYQAHKPPAI